MKLAHAPVFGRHMGDGSIRKVPANKVRKFVARVQGCGERAQLCQLLDAFADCFVDKPGLCDVVTHRIQTTPEFVPRQVRPCRVPAVSKGKVDRQIAELLSMRLIRRSKSDSPMTIPIVCVAKKNGGVCTACDNSYLNSFTERSSLVVADGAQSRTI